MQCTNCGASIPRDAGACPQCGVFARVLRPPKRSGGSRSSILTLLLFAAAAAAGTYYLTRPTPSSPIIRPAKGPVRDQRDAEARLKLSFGVPANCVAVLSKGLQDGAYVFEVANSCEATRLGRWRVDLKSGKVAKAHG